MKAEVDQLDINRLVNVPTSLNNLKTKIGDLDIGKFKTVSIVFKKFVMLWVKKLLKTQYLTH